MERLTMTARVMSAHLHSHPEPLEEGAEIVAHKDVGRSMGEAVRSHDIYACYNCPKEIWPYCKYRRRAKFMSNLDQWMKCLHVKR
jgi:hypothetical protein